MTEVLSTPSSFPPSRLYGTGDPTTSSTSAADTQPLQPLVPKLPPDVDPTKLQLAYGRRAVPKLISELADPDLFTRQRSLAFLADLFHAPENVAQAISEDIVPKLTRMLMETDLTIRQKSTECLLTISSHALGRADIVEHNTLMPLSKLFDDPSDLVRKNTYTTFSHTTLHRSGVDSLLSFSLFPLLIAKLPHERTEIKVPILETCYNCIRLGNAPSMPRDAVECDAMSAFTGMLKMEEVTEVKVAAARCIMMLSFYPDGKQIACKGNTVPVLVDLLTGRKAEVRAAAAGALMSITVNCDAKRMMVRENAIPILMDLLNDKSESVLLNVIKTITNCAEDYRGRFQLHGCIKQLQGFEGSKNQQLAEAARRAVQVITWRP
ncbi:Radial spoke head 14 [Borealophlyctis nickersoniae]|nr:Radial spoke head 14 [Borealophlyctis nickersoniae]